MKALIIGAGQGRRLLPLTETEPKALLDIGGKSILEWQVEALVPNGVTEIVFLAGFNLEAVERKLDHLSRLWPQARFSATYNPFYGVADNLATCWMARSQMDGDFLLLNSDTLFSPGVLERLLCSPTSPISLAIDAKPRYDEDDMKVELDGSRLVDIGKTLSEEQVHGESIGMLLFREDGPAQFVEALNAAMAEPQGLRQWYLSVISALAKVTKVQAVSISGQPWCEIDYPVDVKHARQMVSTWPKLPQDTVA